MGSEGWGFAAPEKAGGSADGLWFGFEQSGVPTRVAAGGMLEECFEKKEEQN